MSVDASATWLIALAQGFVSQAAGYFAFVGLAFLLVWKVGARRLAGIRVATREGGLETRQLRRELANTLGVLATGALNAALIVWLYHNGHTRLSVDAAAFSGPGLAASFVGMLLLNDLWFYGWHRALHHPRVFKHVHAVHHRSVQVNPFTSYSFHVVEAFVLGAWVIPYFVLVPTYLPMVGLMQLVGLANNVNSHLGYELYPRWFIRVPPFRWLTSATYHGLHHARFNGNYGLILRVWDRIFGTEVSDYERCFVERPAKVARSTG